MTWSLSATGHINSQENGAEAEKALAKVLADAINSLPAEDVSSVSFNGNHVSGDLRRLDLEPADVAVDGAEPAAEPVSEPEAE